MSTRIRIKNSVLRGVSLSANPSDLRLLSERGIIIYGEPTSDSFIWTHENVDLYFRNNELMVELDFHLCDRYEADDWCGDLYIADGRGGVCVGYVDVNDFEVISGDPLPSVGTDDPFLPEFTSTRVNPGLEEMEDKKRYGHLYSVFVTEKIDRGK